jgi:hypothetical protein
MARFKLRLPSPALPVALLALFVALGGTGYAALTLPKNSVGSNQIRKGAVKSPKIASNAVTGAKVKRGSLTGSDFKAGTLLQGPGGERGPRGERGDQGPQGNPGANGSPAFGAVLGRGVNVPATPSFLAPSGQLNPNANENNVSSFTPNATMTASDLAVTLSVATGLTDTRTFTLRVGNANTALTCTVPSGNTGCTSTQNVTIPGGSLISIGSTSTGAPMPTDVRFGWRATG